MSENMASEFKFSAKLLDCIERGENDKVRSMLVNKDIVIASDDEGTLLHHAAMRGNAEIMKDLIKLGCDIDARQGNGITALIMAVSHNYRAATKTLLEAGANIHIIGGVRGESALQVAFSRPCMKIEIIEALIAKLRTEAYTTEQLVKNMIAAGSSLYHAACSRDIKVMNCMLNRGFNVNSRGPCQMTALHAAVLQDDLNMAKWLLDRGADIEAADWYDRVPLEIAASRGNRVMLPFLLEHGADPNVHHGRCLGPLYSIFSSSQNQYDKCAEGFLHYDQCAEYLLQHGAIPHNPDESSDTLFDLAINDSNYKQCRLLTAHLAMLEMSGIGITKSVMHCNREENQAKMSKYENYHQSCRQVLTIIMFDKLSLFDLLKASDDKMKLLVRNETFSFKIEELCSNHEISSLYPYYYNILVKRISKVKPMIELEEAAILIIIRLFQSNINECYHVARKLVNYLDECDLQELLTLYQ